MQKNKFFSYFGNKFLIFSRFNFNFKNRPFCLLSSYNYVTAHSLIIILERAHELATSFSNNKFLVHAVARLPVTSGRTDFSSSQPGATTSSQCTDAGVSPGLP
jgi:hypothetical protein